MFQVISNIGTKQTERTRNMANDNVLGTKIGGLMSRNGLSAQALADELQMQGYHANDKDFRKTISLWENGRMPRREDLVMLADYFHTTTDYILGRPFSEEIDVDEVRSAERLLGLSETATRTLITISCCNGSTISEMVTNMLENDRLLDVLNELKKSKDGISRQFKYINVSEGRLQEQSVDMVDMFIVRAMKAIEPLLKDILGYNDLINNIGADSNG